MDNIQLIQLDLTDRALRSEYSASLQNMEEVFTYPLGESQFLIRHGMNHHYDYFSYFEQLGQPYFYVIKSSSSIIGSVCCVLREIKGQQVWYICDLKIIPSAQFRKIPKLIYQLLHQGLLAIASSFYFVNMSPEKHNGLYAIAQRLMADFTLNISPYYIYELAKEDLDNDQVFAHNHGKKDIVIDSKCINLYHVMNEACDRCNHAQYITKDQIEERAVIMLGGTQLREHYKPSSEGIFVTGNFMMNGDLSTFEI